MAGPCSAPWLRTHDDVLVFVEENVSGSTPCRDGRTTIDTGPIAYTERQRGVKMPAHSVCGASESNDTGTIWTLNCRHVVRPKSSKLIGWLVFAEENSFGSTRCAETDNDNGNNNRTPRFAGPSAYTERQRSVKTSIMCGVACVCG